jgi:phosphoribosylanthranilate isomerase
LVSCRIKVCGVTNVADALMCVEEGVDAIGVNFVPGSPRCIDVSRAREISDAVGGRALIVGIVANLDVAAMTALRERSALGCLQLHGEEPPDALAALLPHAYKALRASQVAREGDYGGEHLLVDGPRPGSGIPFDWAIVRALARRRRLTIAGGLDAGNVDEAMAVAAPYCVDVASGVEARGDPRRKDVVRVRALVRAVRGP